MTNGRISLSDWIHFLTTIRSQTAAIVFALIAGIVALFSFLGANIHNKNVEILYLYEGGILAVSFAIISLWLVYGTLSPLKRSWKILNDIFRDGVNDIELIRRRWYYPEGNSMWNIFKNLFFERRVEIEKIESKRGVDGENFEGYYVTKNNCTNNSIKSYMLDSTVILGWDTNGGKDKGSGEWVFRLNKEICKYLKNLNLRIISIRTHEGLHIPVQLTSLGHIGIGSVYINGNPIDQNIELQKEMLSGKDLGIHELGPYPLINWINKDIEEYKIKLAVNEHALWGIDEISLEPIIVRPRIKTSVSLIIGAIISGFIGLFILKLWEYFIK